MADLETLGSDNRAAVGTAREHVNNIIGVNEAPFFRRSL